MGSYEGPSYLGSGEIDGRYDRPAPLPWYYRNQTAVMFWVFVTAALILGLGALLG